MTAGWLPRDAADVGTGEAGWAGGGTMTRIQVRVNHETRRIEEAVFKVIGDSAAVASANLVTERVQGATVEEALAMEPLTVIAELQLSIERAHGATLAIEAAHRAIADWQSRAGSEAAGS